LTTLSNEQIEAQMTPIATPAETRPKIQGKI
jgi:hypothetical protein